MLVGQLEIGLFEDDRACYLCGVEGLLKVCPWFVYPSISESELWVGMIVRGAYLTLINIARRLLID